MLHIQTLGGLSIQLDSEPLTGLEFAEGGGAAGLSGLHAA